MPFRKGPAYRARRYDSKYSRARGAAPTRCAASARRFLGTVRTRAATRLPSPSSADMPLGEEGEDEEEEDDDDLRLRGAVAIRTAFAFSQAVRVSITPNTTCAQRATSASTRRNELPSGTAVS